jgi:hypothetical protein
VDLQEEYFQRNQVKTPLIRYNSSGSIMLECPVANSIDLKWRLFSINVTNKDGDPGRFDLRVYHPQHNGFKNKGMLVSTHFNENEDRCWWENYEERLTRYCSQFLKKWNCRSVVDRSVLGLACWEILLYCYDSCVAELPMSYQDSFHRVLDTNLKVTDRIDQINACIDMLQNSAISSNNPKYLLQGWASLRDYTDQKNYAMWLAKLIGA